MFFFYMELFNFINDNGGYIHPGIERKRGKNGIYGIFTKQKIKKEEILFNIPKKLTINIDTNKIPEKLKLKGNLFLKVYNLLLEKRKGEQSKFKIQLSLYPSLEDLKETESAFFENEVHDAINKTISYFIPPKDKLKKMISIMDPIKDSFTYEEILYAFLIVLRYSWKEALVPGIELMNHKSFSNQLYYKSLSNTLGVDKGKKFFYYKNIADLDKNEEVFIGYGIKSIKSLLFGYGFFDPNNDNFIKLGYSLTSLQPFDFQKSKLLEKFGFKMSLVTKNGKSFIKTHSSPNTVLISKNRIHKKSNEILKILCAENEHELKELNPLKFLKFLRSLCKLNLDNINFEELGNLESKLPSKYFYIVEAIKERVNILKNKIKECNILLNSLIK